tara:strand:- start:616 stop:2178 length:1563 start_codon:yes stop_codon:yes gene_type:complete
MSAIINARSPYYIKINPTQGSIQSATMSLFIYSGNYSAISSVPQYTLTKTVIEGNNYIAFEISSLVKDYLETEYGNFSTDGVWVKTSTVIVKDSGTTTATTANKLVDSTQNFTTSVTSGDTVNNTSDGTTATISAVDNNTTLSLSSDVMTTGETYTIRQTATVEDTIPYLGFDGFGYFQEGVNPRTNTNPINTVVTGTTDGVTVAFKLQDSTQSFLDTVSLGDTVNNLSEGGSTTVSAIEGNTSLALAADIMVSTPDNYSIVARPDYTPALLQSNTTIYFKQGTDIVFPVFAEAEPTITFISGGGANIKWERTDEFWNLYQNYWGSILNPIVVPDSTDSTEKIVYIRVTPTLTLQSGDTITVVSTKTLYEQSFTLTLEAVCEPKYEQLQVIFYNKFGALQIMPFFKRSQKSINVRGNTYNRNIMDFSNAPSYDISKHSIANYGVNGSESIEMNTGFINESFNEVIEEIMLSKQIWVDDSSSVLPINLNTKSLTFKKGVNEGLINYTMSFNYAFSTINNIK